VADYYGVQMTYIMLAGKFYAILITTFTRLVAKPIVNETCYCACTFIKVNKLCPVSPVTYWYIIPLIHIFRLADCDVIVNTLFKPGVGGDHRS
jgi:hypothetical protein